MTTSELQNLDTHHQTILELGAQYGVERGLTTRLARSLGSVGLIDNELIQRTFALGFRLHQDDRRTYEPYNHHLAGVAIELIDELGIDDPEVIAAAPVHDAVEDHAKELASLEFETIPDDKYVQREMAHKALAIYSTQAVADYALEVSNPIRIKGSGRDERIERIAAYMRKSLHLMYEGSAGGNVLKLGDFLNNTQTPPEEDPQKRLRLDEKQVHIFDVHTIALNREDSLVPAEIRPRIQRTLAVRRNRALARLADSAHRINENSLRGARKPV